MGRAAKIDNAKSFTRQFAEIRRKYDYYCFGATDNSINDIFKYSDPHAAHSCLIYNFAIVNLQI